MTPRHLMYVLASAAVLASSVASADERGRSAQAAREMMRQAMLERVAMPRDLPARPDAIMARDAGTSASAAAAAHDHATRMRRSEAERAAHSRAAEHGMRQPGAARREQERRPSGGPMHGGTMGWDGTADMGCGEAAGNTRTMDMHHGGSGGGTPMDGPHMMRATDPPAASSPPAR